ncbi:MAG: hypothetical protein IJI45_15690, partial [Anaerolineaceae bacterium]|nr:hypothetical protein [Anaerolineaceae bacterium]
YSFSGSTIINVFDDHIEFISLGGLVAGLSMEAVFMGASQSRNPNLAAVFYRLGFVESYGTGVRKILRLYKDFAVLPVFRSAEGVFTVELRNRNERIFGNPEIEKAGKEQKIVSAPDDLKERVFEMIRDKGEASRKEVEEKFNIGSTKSYKILKQLCADGLLTQRLNGNKTTYTLAKDNL